jgi:hypothetical protein
MFGPTMNGKKRKPKGNKKITQIKYKSSFGVPMSSGKSVKVK